MLALGGELCCTPQILRFWIVQTIQFSVVQTILIVQTTESLPLSRGPRWQICLPGRSDVVTTCLWTLLEADLLWGHLAGDDKPLGYIKPTHWLF